MIAFTGLCRTPPGEHFLSQACRNYIHRGTTQLGVDIYLGWMMGGKWDYFHGLRCMGCSLISSCIQNQLFLNSYYILKYAIMAKTNHHCHLGQQKDCISLKHSQTIPTVELIFQWRNKIVFFEGVYIQRNLIVSILKGSRQIWVAIHMNSFYFGDNWKYWTSSRLSFCL